MPVPGVDLFLKAQCRVRKDAATGAPLIRDRSDSGAPATTAVIYFRGNCRALYTDENYRALMKPIPPLKFNLLSDSRKQASKRMNERISARPSTATLLRSATFFPNYPPAFGALNDARDLKLHRDHHPLTGWLLGWLAASIIFHTFHLAAKEKVGEKEGERVCVDIIAFHLGERSRARPGDC